MIRAVHADGLLDPATGETAREAVVVIENGRVTHAGRRATVQAPRDAETIDASGLTILPGLIDCHVHLTSLGEGLDSSHMFIPGKGGPAVRRQNAPVI